MTGRRCGAGILGAIGVTAIACGDFARTNPYDPAVAVQITITGPDTLFSWGQVGSYVATSAPPLPDSAIYFTPLVVTPVGNTGTAILTNKAPPLYPTTAVVTFEAMMGRVDTVRTIEDSLPPYSPISIPDIIWRHRGAKSVVLTQRLVRIQLRCPIAHACDALSVGGAWSVWVDGLDSLSNGISGLASSSNPSAGVPIATFLSRDTTIASVQPVGIRSATANARAPGATWIVGVRGSLLDSLRLVVR